MSDKKQFNQQEGVTENQFGELVKEVLGSEMITSLDTTKREVTKKQANSTFHFVETNKK